MNSIIIDIKNLSKRYRLGTISSGTLSQDIASFWSRLSGKTDPNSIIDDESDIVNSSKQNGFVWALKNVSLEIKEGEIIGVIGKNGAGKSTFLKILSRITNPTLGEVKIKGRIGSLLEVGTGFHPELTGRENIYLNGSILGMTKNEITSHLDSIIDFSGVEKYIDTPIKRYSSGMKVRLGFSVAAFLRVDILMIDEVLAVGDAEFQAKAMGKMNSISKGDGKTIIFVSHNMVAINQLCYKTIVFEKGSLINYGESSKVISSYLQDEINEQINNKTLYLWNSNDSDLPACKKVRFVSLGIENNDGKKTNKFDINENIIIKLNYNIVEKLDNSRIIVNLYDQHKNLVFASPNKLPHKISDKLGDHQASIVIEKNFLNVGIYYISLHMGSPGNGVLVKEKVYFIINTFAKKPIGELNENKWPGIVAPKFKWINN